SRQVEGLYRHCFRQKPCIRKHESYFSPSSCYLVPWLRHRLALPCRRKMGQKPITKRLPSPPRLRKTFPACTAFCVKASLCRLTWSRTAFPVTSHAREILKATGARSWINFSKQLLLKATMLLSIPGRCTGSCSSSKGALNAGQRKARPATVITSCAAR